MVFTSWKPRRAGTHAAQRNSERAQARSLHNHATAIASKHNKPFAIARAQSHLETRDETLAREAEQRLTEAQERERWHAKASSLDQAKREHQRYGSTSRRTQP